MLSTFKYRNLSVVSFAVFFIGIPSLCCCLPAAHADQSAQTQCHQTMASHDGASGPQHQTKECDCHKQMSLSVTQNSEGFQLTQFRSDFAVPSFEQGSLCALVPTIAANSSPPGSGSNLPLYLRNSILRI